MIEPRTTTIYQLAERWRLEPEQIIDASIDGKIGLYFRLGNCVIADLPNPNPGHRLQMRHYQGHLRADKATLESILNDGEARHVQEAYLPEGTRVYVELPAQEVAPNVGGHTMRMRVQVTPSLTIKIDDLYALTDEVKAHEKTRPAPANQEDREAPISANSASDAPTLKPKTKRRRTWWDVSSHYIVGVMQAGQYATAKELYCALEAKAGPNSPFNKGTGDSRGSLFVREISRPLSQKTVQNKWQTLRELAQK